MHRGQLFRNVEGEYADYQYQILCFSERPFLRES